MGDTSKSPQSIDTTKHSLTKTQKPEDLQHKAEPSGYKGDSPATAGPGPTEVVSNTPENEKGRLNPSAPENSNTTPGTTGDK